MCKRNLTGIPHEHEIPAPVTTTIFLLLATEREILERVRRVDELVVSSSKLSVIVILELGVADGYLARAASQGVRGTLQKLH